MYFVIEFCEGGDLFDRFSNYGKLPETMVAPIIKQVRAYKRDLGVRNEVASALKYAHSKGIAHRVRSICHI